MNNTATPASEDHEKLWDLIKDIKFVKLFVLRGQRAAVHHAA